MEKCALQVFYTFSEAQNVCNSFLHFLYGYKSRFGILTSQRQRLCQSIPKPNKQRLPNLPLQSFTNPNQRGSPQRGLAPAGPSVCRPHRTRTDLGNTKWKKAKKEKQKTKQKRGHPPREPLCIMCCVPSATCGGQ